MQPRPAALAALSLVLLVALAATGCTAPTPTPTPTPSPSPAPTATPTPEPVGGTVFFLVSEAGEAVHGDSYVLPLTDPDDIAAARALIEERKKDPAASKIVLATIAAGSGDGSHVNRDLAGGQGKAWSWHVTEFGGFADMTVEIYDGWPTFVEEDLDGWIANTKGVVGFWSYTVTRELTADEVAP